MDKYKTKQSAQYSYKGKKPKVGKPGAGAMFIQLKSLKSLLGLKKGGDTMLKPVPADKKKSLGKLPTDVRNKMGYAKKGKMITGKKEEDDVSKYLKSIKIPDAKDVRDVVNKKAMGGEMMKAKKGKDVKLMENISKESIVGKGALKTSKKSMGGEMKQGYGAARTSGMGLQDEDLIPGKSMDYYKDLM